MKTKYALPVKNHIVFDYLTKLYSNRLDLIIDEDLYLKIQQSFKEVFTLELQQSTAHKYGITLTHSP